MASYEKPIIQEISDFIETVNLGSGEQGGGGSTPPPAPTGNGSLRVRWKGHDGGSHSVIGVMAKSNVPYTTNNVQGAIRFIGPQKMRVAWSNPNDGFTHGPQSVSFDETEKIIRFNVSQCNNGVNSGQEDDIGLGSYEFSNDGVSWNAYVPTGGQCGNSDFCDSLFTVIDVLYY